MSRKENENNKKMSEKGNVPLSRNNEANNFYC